MKVILQDVSMDGRPRVAAPQNLDGAAWASGHPSALQSMHNIIHMFLFNTSLCIGNALRVCDDEMMGQVSIRVLPQVHRILHVDEAGVFAELPVRVVGDPPLPVIGINHFPERKDTRGES